MPNKPKKKILWRIITIAAGTLLFLLIVYLVIGAYAISQVTLIGEFPKYYDTPATFGVEYQEITFPARIDGLEIAAWYLPNEPSDKAIIIVHGRDTSKQRAESGTIVAFQADLYKAGYSVLAIDLRAHGDSDGDRYSFGVYERRDVLGAVDFLKEEGFESGKIGVVSISLGGAAAIGAMAESEDIGAVITEGTFGNFKPIIYEQWESESGLPSFFLPGVFLMNRIMYGYSLAEVNSAEEIANASPRPMLFIHCREDEIISVSHVQELLQAAPHAESWILDNCEHGELYRDFPVEYSNRVITFFNENL